LEMRFSDPRKADKPTLSGLQRTLANIFVTFRRSHTLHE
jgi:hypothetical protein